MKKVAIILIIVILLIIIGVIGYGLAVCPDGTESGYVSGYLNVYFKENITYQEAEDIIKSYNLRHSQQDASSEIKENYQIIFNELHYLGVIVPEGKEQEWKENLLEVETIENVQFVQQIGDLPEAQSPAVNTLCKFINFVW